MKRYLIQAISLSCLLCTGASAKDYSDADCAQGSRDMTLRLIRVMPTRLGPPFKWDGQFEITNSGRSTVSYAGNRVRGRFVIDFPEVSMQVEDANDVWEDAVVYLGGVFYNPDKLTVPPGQKAAFVTSVDWSPDFISGLANSDLKMPLRFRMFLRDRSRNACLASEPFSIRCGPSDRRECLELETGGRGQRN
jgi:hypothetical protein